jgi:hypothetical protein
MMVRRSNRKRSHHRIPTVYAIVFLIDVISLFTLHGAPLTTSAAAPTSTSSTITSQQRQLAIKQLRTLVPPPTNRRSLCGDYILNDDAYARYLSVSNWDPILAAPKLVKSIDWMTTMKPWTLRPYHCPVLCKQYAWVPLMVECKKKKSNLRDDCGGGGTLRSTSQVDDDAADDDEMLVVNDDASSGADGNIIHQQSTNNNNQSNIGHEYITGLCALGNSARRTNNPYNRSSSYRKKKKIQDIYDQPYDCPSSYTWRTTSHGLPITLFTCSKWRPDLAKSPYEMDIHAAYTMTHLIKRIPRKNNKRRGKVVTRVCIIFDLYGFETWMLPYIHRNIELLREHYPGRAGAFCFINSPALFRGVWKLISPWLDDELQSKVHFANSNVNTVEDGIEYLNRLKLRVGPV